MASSKKEAAYYRAFRDLGPAYLDLYKEQREARKTEGLIGQLPEDQQFLARLYANQDTRDLAASMERKRQAEENAARREQANRTRLEIEDRNRTKQKLLDETIVEEKRVRDLDAALTGIDPGVVKNIKTPELNLGDLTLGLAPGLSGVTVPSIENQRVVRPPMITRKGADLIMKLGGTPYLQGVRIYEEWKEDIKDERDFRFKVMSEQSREENRNRKFSLSVEKEQFKRENAASKEAENSEILTRTAMNYFGDPDRVAEYEDIAKTRGFSEAMRMLHGDKEREDKRNQEQADRNEKLDEKLSIANEKYWSNKKQIEELEKSKTLEGDSSKIKDLYKLKSEQAELRGILGADPTVVDIWKWRREHGLSVPGKAGTEKKIGEGEDAGAKEPTPKEVKAIEQAKRKYEHMVEDPLENELHESQAKLISEQTDDPEMGRRFRFRYRTKLAELSKTDPENATERAYMHAYGAIRNDMEGRHVLTLKMQPESVDVMASELDKRYGIKLSSDEKTKLAKEGEEGETMRDISLKVTVNEYKKEKNKDMTMAERAVIRSGYMIGDPKEVDSLSQEFKDFIVKHGGVEIKSLPGMKLTQDSFTANYKDWVNSNPITRIIGGLGTPLIEAFDLKEKWGGENWYEGNILDQVFQRLVGGTIKTGLAVFQPFVEFGGMIAEPFGRAGLESGRGKSGAISGFQRGIKDWWNGDAGAALKEALGPADEEGNAARQLVKSARNGIRRVLGTLGGVPILGPFGSAAVTYFTDPAIEWMTEKVWSFFGDGDADYGFTRTMLDVNTWVPFVGGAGKFEQVGSATAKAIPGLASTEARSLALANLTKQTRNVGNVEAVAAIEKRIWPGEVIRQRLGGEFKKTNFEALNAVARVLKYGVKRTKDGKMISVLDTMTHQQVDDLFKAVRDNANATLEMQKAGLTKENVLAQNPNPVPVIGEFPKFPDHLKRAYELLKKRDDLFSKLKIGDLLDEVAQIRRAEAALKVPATKSGIKALETVAGHAGENGVERIASMLRAGAFGKRGIPPGETSGMLPGDLTKTGRRKPGPMLVQKKTLESVVDEINSVVPGTASLDMSGQIQIVSRPFGAVAEIARATKPGVPMSATRAMFERWGNFWWNDIVKGYTWNLLPKIPGGTSIQRMFVLSSSELPPAYMAKETVVKSVLSQFDESALSVLDDLTRGLSKEERVVAQKVLRSGHALNPEIWKEATTAIPGGKSAAAYGKSLAPRAETVAEIFKDDLAKIKDPKKFVENIFNVRDKIDRLSVQAAEMGFLERETFFKGVGQYNARMYLEYELEGAFNKLWRKLGLGGNKDLSRFKARTLTEAEAKAKGYIAESGYTEAKEIQQVGRNIALAKHFADVARSPKMATYIVKPGQENWVFVKNQSELANRIRAEARRAGSAAEEVRIAKELNTLKFGQLSGMYVHPDVWARVNPMVDLRTDVGKFYDLWMSKWRFGKVVLNPSSHGRNFVTNTALAMTSMGEGPLDPRAWYHFARDVKGFIANEMWVQNAARDGALGHGYLSNELNHHLDEILRFGMDDTSKGLIGKLSGYFRKFVSNRAASWYQKSEQFNRARLYRHATEKLGMSGADAAAWAVKHGIDYEDIGWVVRLARRIGPPFITWSVKAIPLIAENMVRHPLVVSQFAALYWGVNEYAAHKQGWNDDDIDAAAGLMPEKIKGRALARLSVLHLPWKDSKGQTQFLDLNYLLPFNDIASFIPSVEDPTAIGSSIMGNPLIGTVADLMYNKNLYTGKPIWGEFEEGPSKWAKIFDHTFKKFMPALTPTLYEPLTTGGTSFDKILALFHDRRDYMGRAKSMGATLADVFTGMKVFPVDFEETAMWQTIDKKRKYEDLVRAYNKVEKDVRNRKISEASGERDKKRIEAQINHLLDDQLKILREMER